MTEPNIDMLLSVNDAIDKWCMTMLQSNATDDFVRLAMATRENLLTLDCGLEQTACRVATLSIIVNSMVEVHRSDSERSCEH